MSDTGSTPRLRVDGITREFVVDKHERRLVLDDISFDVAPGEFISLVGPSGAGKSTLFNIIAGLDTPTSGRVLIDGREATGSTEHAAYMPQKDLLFPWRTIAANAALGLEVQGMNRQEARARVREWFPRFGLEGYEDAHPFELSGGMRQRAALLRTVVQDRRILLLDEPFGALDSLTRQQLHAWLQGVWAENDWTAILITHDVREAVALSDRVIVLSPRPARIRGIIDVDLPRPRSIEDTASREFASVEKQIFDTLLAE
ncbi:ABC transporter ATP-binding protein [Corynebacterium aquatimens]|uniref:ABC-type nitrate/sulfonate/bicarbonate transport system ATPase subunit n=1 Tax=Corynebacterium aquatimens TaxID=1190508 RepID=A0A931GXW8_9CORY|nr:ABC transporter ATP-binding protein [Corynebacterium aquatimens]MBG6122669.1 ABC-type nitrate/sulfonate/bicarbonate transport system ATPase subunit [Corynebacterium aquatimens]WJY64800.1 Aliphatic sulfonates import ATP-binding protein SsuB [Corynebacterium aquatimens]